MSKSLLTDNLYTYNPNNKNNSGILDHLHEKDECNGTLDNFEIIGKANNDYFLRIKESLLIKKSKPTINSKEQSIPLYLF